MGDMDTMIALRRQMRTEHMQVEVDGVPVDCTYYLDGEYIPGNEYDPPEVPSVVLVRAEIGGVNVTDWEDRFEFSYLIEQALAEEVA
jgi:hypothetical protein